MNKILYFAIFSVTIAGVLGSQAAFAGELPFDGEDNVFWAGCFLEAGQNGQCDFIVGDSIYDITPNFIPNWGCINEECVIRLPNFIDPLQLKQFHITAGHAEVDSIECFDAQPDFDELNDVKSFGSRDSSVPVDVFGVIEEWHCEPNPDFEVIFLTLTGNEVSFVDIHTVSKIEPREVGGEIIPIEATSLILAGAQSFSWMIPLVISGIGIGLFVVSRKSENS